MNKSRMIAAATALACTLSACTTGGTMTYGSSYTSYDPTAPRQIRAAGPMEVTLIGSPFAASDVVRVMNSVPNVHELTFGPDANSAQFGYRIAINFTSNASNPCGPQASNSMPLGNDAKTLVAVAGFCRFGGTLARTTAIAARPANPDSPEFQEFLRTLVVQLMPAYKPQGIDGSDCASRPNC